MKKSSTTNNESIISLDSPTKSDKTVYIYFNPKPTIRVCLRFFKEDVNSMTALDLIGKCIKSLTDDYLLHINQCRFSYCLYPANRTGSKKTGAMELDSKSIISDLNTRRFYL